MILKVEVFVTCLLNEFDVVGILTRWWMLQWWDLECKFMATILVAALRLGGAAHVCFSPRKLDEEISSCWAQNVKCLAKSILPKPFFQSHLFKKTTRIPSPRPSSRTVAVARFAAGRQGELRQKDLELERLREELEVSKVQAQQTQKLHGQLEIFKKRLEESWKKKGKCMGQGKNMGLEKSMRVGTKCNEIARKSFGRSESFLRRSVKLGNERRRNYASSWMRFLLPTRPDWYKLQTFDIGDSGCPRATVQTCI